MLAPARSLQGGPDAVLDFLRRFGSIQYDPIAVAGRSHDIVLHARIAGYDPAWCDVLYERREIFEAVNKGLSFVPASDYPWFRGTSSRRRGASSPRTPRRPNGCSSGSASTARSPRSTSSASAATTVDWFGVKTNVVRAVLEAYTVTGVLGLARRDGNRRYYDLIERLLPKKVLAREVPLHDQLRHKMLSRYRAHGLLGASSGGGVFDGLGPAKPDSRFPEYPGRTALREQLVEDGELVPVEVEGVRGKRFVVRDEVELLAAPPEPPPSVAFLSPFDPLVWDRALLGSLFEFDYVWDLFHPPEKRRFGYYVLPILFCDRFVGRIEPKIDRSGGPVQVLGLWWEDGFAPRRADGFVEAMRSALCAYLGFAGADRSSGHRSSAAPSACSWPGPDQGTSSVRLEAPQCVFSLFVSRRSSWPSRHHGPDAYRGGGAGSCRLRLG